MKKLSFMSMKTVTAVLFLFGLSLLFVSFQYAQEKIPGVRTLSTRDAERVVFGQTIKPREVIKADHVANGIALRNRGGGVINLRGTPEGSKAVKAYLYWDILADEAPKTATVSVNGVHVKGKLIGQGPDPCWAVSKNFVYRANVPLFLLYEGINGDYKVTSFASSQGFGMSPWEFTTGAYLAEGVSLVVFYVNRGSTYKTTYIYDKPVSGQMFTSGFSAVLAGFNAPLTTAKFTMLGADGQVSNGLRASYSITAETSFFQGNQIAGPACPPGGSLHDADSDWNGSDGEPLNQLWDTRTHIVPIKKGSTSAKVRYKSNGDCLVIVAFFLSL